VTCSTHVKVISTGLLALLLLPVLHRGKAPPFKPHLVIVASSVHDSAKLGQRKQPGILAALNDEKTYNAFRYEDTKRPSEICSPRARARS